MLKLLTHHGKLRKIVNPETDDKKAGKCANKRVAFFSLLTKAKPKKKGRCVLCGSAKHNVILHRMAKHGSCSLNAIKNAFSEMIAPRNVLE